ncbi:hypothetical protein ACQ4PT_047618 [Festuca glaucescens]
MKAHMFYCLGVGEDKQPTLPVPHDHPASHLIASPVMVAECQKLLPIVVNSSKNRVPDIKFNVAKVLRSLVHQSFAEKTLKPCLVELSEDTGVDVRYYTNQALEACDQTMVSS